MFPTPCQKAVYRLKKPTAEREGDTHGSITVFKSIVMCVVVSYTLMLLAWLHCVGSLGGLARQLGGKANNVVQKLLI